MTRKLDFDLKWTRLKETVERNHLLGIPDVAIMEKLGFTPPSWKNWKPKLIEKANTTQMNYYDHKNNNQILYRISYNKKGRRWGIVFDKYKIESILN